MLNEWPVYLPNWVVLGVNVATYAIQLSINFDTPPENDGPIE